jgi:hypothetical protein
MILFSEYFQFKNIIILINYFIYYMLFFLMMDQIPASDRQNKKVIKLRNNDRPVINVNESCSVVANTITDFDGVLWTQNILKLTMGKVFL